MSSDRRQSNAHIDRAVAVGAATAKTVSPRLLSRLCCSLAMSDLTTKPPANYAPVYAAIYPGLAEVFRRHGYALAVHGSLARDFDLIAVPWVERPSRPFTVIEEIEAEFAIKRVGTIGNREHGRMVVSLSIGHGECALDLSFTPIRIDITNDTIGGFDSSFCQVCDMAEITGEWLESIGFLQDGDDSENKEYGKRAWSLSHLENSDDDTANMMQVLVSAVDHSVWLEVYDHGGDSLALIEVPGGTQKRILNLCEALGIKAHRAE